MIDQVETKRDYMVIDGFFKRPRRWPFVEVADVAIDVHDNVWVFSRSPHPVMVFDKNGQYLQSWGEMSEHFFNVPHGISLDGDGNIYTVDTGDHTARKWTSDGRLLMVLGEININAPKLSGIPFNKPTQLSVASNGDLYVADGYGNAHIHCFDPEGNFKFSWGEYGSSPGQFNLVHGVFVDTSDNDKVYVADRYNDRVQVFTRTGEYLNEWDDLLMPNCVRRGPEGAFYVAEMGHRVTVFDSMGKVLARWGDGAEKLISDEGPRALRSRVVNEPGAGLFASPHGVAVDSEGSVYVAEVAESVSGLDRGDRCIQKFVRV